MPAENRDAGSWSFYVMNPAGSVQLEQGSSRLAAEWLLKSGIQDRQKESPHIGGVHAWYDLRLSTRAFYYSEITGYAVSAYLFFYQLTGNDDFLDSARAAANWLVRNAYPESGLVKTREGYGPYQTAYFDQWIFIFDQWIIVYGLANLFEVNSEERYLDHAKKMAEFLLHRTVRSDGTFFPVFDRMSGESKAANDKWSRQTGSFHAKALMALTKLYQLSKNDRFLQSAATLAEKTLQRQEDDGRFITLDSEGSTHLHPFAYTLEGLLSFAIFRNDSVLFSTVENGVKWALKGQQEDGSIYCFFKGGRYLPFVRVDVLAQVLRLGQILMQHGYLCDSSEPLSRLQKHLLRYQMEDGIQAGGFLYGQEENGLIHYHVNAWVTMFAAQALAMRHSFNTKINPYSMTFFV